MEQANFFRRCREAASLSQFDAAVKIGVTPSAISSWDRGQNPPSLRKAARIAQAYGVSEKRVTDAIVEMSRGIATAAK